MANDLLALASRGGFETGTMLGKWIVRLRQSLRSFSFHSEVKGYLENSSVHGLKYIIEKHRPYFERVSWAVLLVGSLILAGYYTEKVWNTTPILKDTSAVHGNDQVPLPAITICSNAKVSKRSNWGQGKTLNKDLHTLRYICGEAFPNSREISVSRLNETGAVLESTCTLDILHANGTLLQENCGKMFQKVVTEQGICYTFNGYHPKHIYRQDVFLGEVNASWFGYQSQSEVTTERSCGDWLPVSLLNDRAPDPGVVDHLMCGNHTLKLSLFSTRDDTGYCTYSNKTGFKLLIHNPKDVPIAGVRRLIWTKEEENERHSIDISTDSKITVKVEAKLNSHSGDLLWFGAEKRGCYAENERYLRFFKTYTQENCILECLANRTKELCHCADFFMPRLAETEVCKRIHLTCIFDVIDLFRKKDSDYCNCYPSCYRVDYTPQVRLIQELINKDLSWNDASLTVKVEREVREVMSYPSFTDVQVISSCGGVYGIFVGMSLLSFFEILYFFCIRLCGNYYKELKKSCKPSHSNK